MDTDRDKLFIQKQKLDALKHKGACVLDMLKASRTGGKSSDEAIERYASRSLDSIFDSLIDELEALRKK